MLKYRSRSKLESLEARTLFSVPPLTGASQDLGGKITTDVADPVRNVAYIYDTDANHILAIDTSTGTTAAAVTPAAAVAGLAVSVDDTELFASEPTAFAIQVYSLPDMTFLKTLNVGVAVGAIAAIANNRLIGDTGSMTGFDTNTAATVFTLPEDNDGLFKASLDGTKLYERARGLSGSDGSITVYDTSGTSTPVAESKIPGPTGANSTDFAVDTVGGHAYFGDGGADGVEVTLLGDGSQTDWAFDGGGAVNGLAAFPGASDVFASTFDGKIGEFNQSGTEVGEWTPASGVTGQTMVVTPNGNVLSLFATGVNIVGLSSLDITQAPASTASVTTLTSSASTIAFGSSVTLTATVAPASGVGSTPTGSVDFTANGTSLGTEPLDSSGTATLKTTALPGGTDTVVAGYGGDGNYQASNSSSVDITVSQATSVTTITSVSPASAPAGTVITVTGKVTSPVTTGPVPTGTVELLDGTTDVGSASVGTGGAFTLTTSMLPAGNDSLTVQYSGDDTYASSNSAAASVTIAQTASITSITSATPDLVIAGNPVTVIGTVGSQVTGGPTPTGTVNLLAGTTQVGTGPVEPDGSFSIATTSLPVGADSITAQYSGDGTFTPSTSTATTVTVTPAPTGVAVTSVTSVLPNPQTAGSPVVFTGAVTPVSGSTAIPTGAITFFYDGQSVGVATLAVDGSFSFNISTLPVGLDFISVNYGGDTNYAANSAPGQTVTITPADSGVPTAPVPVASVTTLSNLFPNPASASIELTIKGTVAAATGSGGTPTGSVSIYDGTAFVGTANLQTDGSFFYQTNALPQGADSLTATYSGDTDYEPSTSSPQTETIASSVALPTFDSLRLPTAVVAGKTVAGSIPVTITNYGSPYKGSFTVTLFVSRAAVLDGSQVQVGTTHRNLSLKNQKSAAFHFGLRTLPATLASGTYYFLAQVIGPDGTASTAEATQTIQVQAPFVALTAAATAVTPAIIKIGRPGAIFVTVTNAGNVDAVGTMTITLGTAADGTARLISVSSMTRIKPGRYKRVRVSFKTTTLAAGTYIAYVSVALDGQTATAMTATEFTLG